ncbi:hypothetical protein MicloDRAFT_00064630 [Microvirga lotononidis]|uniref:Uncharacterized protein n=1 Tax=Microvirga lotononidis TaxID=864069 RepID=I4YP44_9HYPH|nr:hypothetical protein MicloDRAFT_00064630 [Microvirga lotononidis]
MEVVFALVLWWGNGVVLVGYLPTEADCVSAGKETAWYYPSETGPKRNSLNFTCSAVQRPVGGK